MNWYRSIKTAQIWNIDIDYEDFGDVIQVLHELEYKYSMIRDRPFQGLPQRRENILKQLHDYLMEVLTYTKKIVLYTFQEWLSSHAILDPERWAQQRVNSYGDNIEEGEIIDLDTTRAVKTIFEGISGEHMEYTNKIEGRKIPPGSYQRALEISFSKMLKDAVKNPNEFPGFSKLLELYLEDYKENIMADDLQEEGYKEFGERYGKKFRSNREAKQFIKNISLEEYGPENILDLIGSDEIDLFANAAYHTDLWQEIATEFCKNIIFPKWYGFWKREGIEETRENIEKIYELLKNANTVEEITAAISMALNASHQTGSMLSYLEENSKSYDLESILFEIQNRNTNDWDNELREIGVQI